MTALVVIEFVLLTLLALLVTGLLRAYADLLGRLRALEEPGHSAEPRTESIPRPEPREEWSAAFDIAGTTAQGETAVLRTVQVEHDTVLLFLSSGCSTCATFWSELGAPGAVRLPSNTRLAALTQGEEHESIASVRALAPLGVTVVMSTQAWEDYGVPGSPYAVLVDGRTGRVRGEGTGAGWRQVAELLAAASGDAGYLTGGPSIRKPRSDAAREAEVDRELLAAGLLPGDPRLYQAPDPQLGAPR